MYNLDLTISLPDWVHEFLRYGGQGCPSVEERMRMVIGLSRQNIRQRTGGPFGAAVFDEAGVLVAAGVNIVERSNCSILHAEMVAIALAQKRLGRYDLSGDGTARFELVTAAEPCAMCFGAIPWSGVSRVVCGARDEDIRAIGFDEGPKLTDWVAALQARNIEVVRDVLRDQAAAVLQEYARMGGVVYNSGGRGVG